MPCKNSRSGNGIHVGACLVCRHDNIRLQMVTSAWLHTYRLRTRVQCDPLKQASMPVPYSLGNMEQVSCMRSHTELCSHPCQHNIMCL